MVKETTCGGAPTRRRHLQYAGAVIERSSFAGCRANATSRPTATAASATEIPVATSGTEIARAAAGVVNGGF